MKVLFLELNEFHAEVLAKGAEQLGLENLKRLCASFKSTTWTEDTYESDFLEPWVQWVSVHTGITSSGHKVKHLGDVPHLEHPQFWELLSERGVTSGIWGAMNASRGSAKECLFFVPDPWTASEDAYPEELNCLLDPIRYVSKNYLNRSSLLLLKKVKRLLGLLIANGLGKPLLRELLSLPGKIAKYGMQPFVFIALADLLSTHLFLQYRKRYNPDFSLIFLNSLAHLQHHHWHGMDFKGDEPLAYGLRNMDRILGLLFASMREGEIFCAANALSQENTNEDKPWILYRQIDQAQFLKKMKIPFIRVEPHMTHDAHIFFENEEAAKRGKTLLEGARIEGKPLFLVESYADFREKLFYRIAFTDAVPSDVTFQLGGASFRFFDLFKPIVQRTGKHIQEGTVFCSKNHLPPRMKNEELLKNLWNTVPTASAPLEGGLWRQKAL
ncbi:MAG: hypothetical protein KGI80_05015 [Verrucomicrobiota bacterium]|nr:hypothetical protein [Verrucomicrobiota bacterium]